MGPPDAEPTFSAFLSTFADRLGDILISPGSTFSLLSLAIALALATAFLAGKRLRRGRRPRPRVIARALFRTFRMRPSMTADLFYFAFNALVAGSILSGAILSYAAVAAGTHGGLERLFGPSLPPAWPELLSRSAVTLAIFLAYELGYWVDHWLSHKIPILWDFHKVHHTADVLTPWTVWRVHPMETLKFANIVALSTGVAKGVATYLLGEVNGYALSGTNVILVVFVLAYLHLQHSHLWIPFRGWLGRLLVSPAHHQIHHSSHPAHHNRNLGSCLAVWDWAFGTLHIPAREPEKLSFGVEAGQGQEVHALPEVTVAPFLSAARRLPRLGRRWILRPLRRLGIAAAPRTGPPSPRPATPA